MKTSMKALVICCTKCRYLFSLLSKELKRSDQSSDCCLTAVAANVETKELRAFHVVKIFERFV